MSCVHFTPAQGRSRGRAPLFLIQEYPRLPGFPSDVYGIMTQRSDSARPRPYAELDQALHTLGGYVLLLLCVMIEYDSDSTAPHRQFVTSFSLSLVSASDIYMTCANYFRASARFHWV